MTKHVSLGFIGSWLFLLLAQITYAQCSYTTYIPTSIPDECDNALDGNTYFNNCTQICVDLSLATPSTNVAADPACGAGAINNDIWQVTTDPYTNIPGYDGSLVFAWKDYPGFPNDRPTVYTHIEFDGAGYVSIFPAFTSTIDCTDGFEVAGFNLSTCSDTSATVYDNNQTVLPPNTVPTNDAIAQGIIEGSNGLLTSAEVNSLATWSQIDAFNAQSAGVVCFEVSTYASGFSCGDPTVLTFTGANGSETQNVSNCLCATAQNGGYYSLTNTPCNTGDYTGTTAFYQLNAPYACNQISADLLAWSGNGSLNVTILSELLCPDIEITDSTGAVVNSFPGLLVDSATLNASACMDMNGTTNVQTSLGDCLPMGTYYVLVNGNVDKSDFVLDITVNDNSATPTIVVKANVWLEGAYSGTDMLTTLNDTGALPLEQPYNVAPWNYGGAEMVTTANDIPINAVDWVLLKVRDATDYTVVLETHAAFVLNNGTIVTADGSLSEGVNFYNLVAGTDYYLSVEHRNHLGVLSANMVALPNATSYDFSVVSNVWAGLSQTSDLGGGVSGLRAGDNNSDGVINYVDFNFYVDELPIDISYPKTDCNFDGLIDGADFTLYFGNAGTIGIDAVRY